MITRKSGHATGMAGEFFVMERLFRAGHEPALTLGNAKNVDILVATHSGPIRKISVKAVQGGGKWPVGKSDYSSSYDLIFVFLRYKSFGDLITDPDVWVMPATHVQARKQKWIDGAAIYYAHSTHVPVDLNEYKNAWHHLASPS
jgi:hypothetical protein